MNRTGYLFCPGFKQPVWYEPLNGYRNSRGQGSANNGDYSPDRVVGTLESSIDRSLHVQQNNIAFLNTRVQSYLLFR